MRLPRPNVSTLIRIIEYVLAFTVLVGVVIASIGAVQTLATMDWTKTETFYELIYRVLLLVIGLELVRMLIAHSLSAVLELIAFVIARKMLKPDITSFDIALSVAAFVALIVARHAFVVGHEDCMQGRDEDERKDKKSTP